MSCPVCYEAYNSTSVLPKLLLCGHDYCKICLDEYIRNKRAQKDWIECFVCKKVTRLATEALPTVYSLIGLEQANSSACNSTSTEWNVTRSLSRPSLGLLNSVQRDLVQVHSTSNGVILALANSIFRSKHHLDNFALQSVPNVRKLLTSRKSWQSKVLTWDSLQERLVALRGLLEKLHSSCEAAVSTRNLSVDSKAKSGLSFLRTFQEDNDYQLKRLDSLLTDFIRDWQSFAPGFTEEVNMNVKKKSAFSLATGAAAAVGATAAVGAVTLLTGGLALLVGGAALGVGASSGTVWQLTRRKRKKFERLSEGVQEVSGLVNSELCDLQQVCRILTQ